MRRPPSRVLIVMLEAACLVLVATRIRMVNMINRSWLLFAVLIVATWAIGRLAAGRFGARRDADRANDAADKENRTHAAFLKAAAPTGVLIVLFALLGSQALYSRLAVPVQEAVFGLIWPQLNRREVAEIERGYYENLLSVDWFTSELMEKYTKPVDWWPGEIEKSGIEVRRDDFLRLELAPSKEVVYYGRPFHTNRWGMRDKDYALKKPPGTYRIALLGPSIVLGWGVSDDETYERIVEDRLNRENQGGRYDRYEILNFAVSDYCVLQQLMILDDRVFPFEPDMVLYTAHLDKFWSSEHLAHCVHERIPMPLPFLRDALARAGIEDGMPEVLVKKRIKPFMADIIYQAYRTIVTRCRERGIVPVWDFVPLLGMPQMFADERAAEVTEVAHLAGVADFVVINMDDVFDGYDPAKLKVTAWDAHPNALGHRLIARRLYHELVARNDVLSLGLDAARVGGP